jgi:hypothetical protein
MSVSKVSPSVRTFADSTKFHYHSDYNHRVQSPRLTQGSLWLLILRQTAFRHSLGDKFMSLIDASILDQTGNLWLRLQ